MQNETKGSITDVPGIKVGHFTEERRPTGCTVVISDKGATAGVDVRGGAPGTRETDLLDPVNLVEKVHAVLLTGGSAFGLDAASGVMQYLEEREIGYDVKVTKVPIVPAAVLIDLHIGDPKIRPTSQSGYKACLAATTGPVAEGNVGAGAGATVGKAFGLSQAMKGGLGTASLKVPGGIIMGAIVAVNALGDIRDPKTGKILAGARTPDGRGFADTMEKFKAGVFGAGSLLSSPQNTTIGVVATNVILTKAQASKVAQMAQDGFARTITPAHTPYDGDTIFALSTRTVTSKVDVGIIGALAAEVMAEAVIRAILNAESIKGFPSSKDLLKK